MSGLFSSPSAPEAPDMDRLIRLQGEINRINQTTPFGSLSFLTDAEVAGQQGQSVFTPTTRVVEGAGPPLNPITGRPIVGKEGQGMIGGTSSREVQGFLSPEGEFVEQLPQGAVAADPNAPPTNAILETNPEIQSIIDSLTSGAQSRAEQIPSGPFDPTIPSVGGTEAGALGPFDQSTQAQQAVFQQAQSLLEPQFEQREEQLRQTLANQGLPIGSEAFEGEFNRFDRERNRAFNEAAMQSVLAGNQRQGQLFQQGLSALGAEQGVRQQNIGEIGQLLGTGQGAAPQLGSFFGPSPADVTGPAQLQQQGQLAGFNAQQQQQSAMLGGLASLGSAAIFASDRRLKRFIRRIGEVAGLPLYTFKYLWSDDWQVGHMADEVEKAYPKAVIRDANGYMMVDYSQVWG